MELKKEHRDISDILKKEFNSVTDKLKYIDKQMAQAINTFEDIFLVYQMMDPSDKKQFVSLLPPAEVNFQTGDVSIQIDSALVKILRHKKEIVFKNSALNNTHSDNSNFTVRNISLKRAVEILAKNNIEVSDCEATIILNFLYHIAQNHNKQKAYKRQIP